MNVRFSITMALLWLSYAVFAGELEQTAIPAGARTADSWLAYLHNKIVFEHGYGAIAAGLLVSWTLTHMLKMTFPVEWSERKRDWRVKWSAFWIGAVTTLAVWPLTFELSRLNGQQIYAMVMVGLVLAVCVGGGSPFAYKLVVGTVTNQLVKRGFIQPHQVSAAANAEMRRTAQSSTPENGVA